MDSKLNIGITIFLQEENHSVWTNGIMQNAVYLARTFQNSSKKYNVYLVNTSNTNITNKLCWNLNEYKTVQFNDIKDKLDIIFPLGGSIDKPTTEYLRNRGCKVVPYKCGNEYIISMENIIFNRQDIIKDYPEVDQVWNIPQMENTNHHYWRVLHNAETITIPFIWNPMFLNMHIDELKKQGKNPYYTPSKLSKKISIFEPNINVYKFLMYPMLIIEDLYREYPHLIKSVMVTNTQKVRLTKELGSIMNQLSIVHDKKATFENRFPVAWFLTEHTDVVVSHQWENALNYAYLDAIYLKYPLVHNAYLCEDCGYYYEGFNVTEGKEQLLYALTEHDKHLEEYDEKTQKVLERYSTDNKEVVEKYDELISNLMNTKSIISNFVPTSFGAFKSEIKDYILTNFDNDKTTILDVGAGCGTYADILNEYKNIDAVEIYEPYINKYDLKTKYRKVYKTNILDFEFDYYDIIIMGDILEHLTIDDAQNLINKLYNKCKQLIISVPFLMKQYGLENKNEDHIQDDITEEIMVTRYPSLQKTWSNNIIGVYFKK
jgi:hypothetical protein